MQQLTSFQGAGVFRMNIIVSRLAHVRQYKGLPHPTIWKCPRLYTRATIYVPCMRVVRDTRGIGRGRCVVLYLTFLSSLSSSSKVCPVESVDLQCDPVFCVCPDRDGDRSVLFCFVFCFCLSVSLSLARPRWLSSFGAVVELRGATGGEGGRFPVWRRRDFLRRVPAWRFIADSGVLPLDDPNVKRLSILRKSTL